MRKIIGAALIVLSLAGCSPGNLAGDSDWSRGYFKVADKEQRAN
jgi:Prokaryotic membrane lipoprotein lipid attachment site